MILENLHKGCEELRSGQTSAQSRPAGITDDEGASEFGANDDARVRINVRQAGWKRSLSSYVEQIGPGTN